MKTKLTVANIHHLPFVDRSGASRLKRTDSGELGLGLNSSVRCRRAVHSNNFDVFVVLLRVLRQAGVDFPAHHSLTDVMLGYCE